MKNLVFVSRAVSKLRFSHFVDSTNISSTHTTCSSSLPCPSSKNTELARSAARPTHRAPSRSTTARTPQGPSCFTTLFFPQGTSSGGFSNAKSNAPVVETPRYKTGESPGQICESMHAVMSRLGSHQVDVLFVPGGTGNCSMYGAMRTKNDTTRPSFPPKGFKLFSHCSHLTNSRPPGCSTAHVALLVFVVVTVAFVSFPTLLTLLSTTTNPIPAANNETYQSP